MAAVLNIPVWGAVGVLESLWHFAQKYSPDGNVGRHTDEAIARGIGWDGNASTLVSGLVQAGWLDRCLCHRARVHDWPEHADLTVRRSVNNLFIPCYQDPKAVLPKPEETIATVSAQLASVEVSTERIGSSTVSPAVPCRAVPSLAKAKATATAVAAVAAESLALVPPNPKPWSAEAIDDHRELKGEPVAGKVLSALKPLVDRYGWPEVRVRWREFLVSPDARYGPLNFAENYLARARGQPPARASPRPTVGSQTADVIREIARREGKG